LCDEYALILGKAACQQVARKNSEAWRSFFQLLEQYRSNDPSVTENPIWVREHSCSSCGFECNRDANAAMNVLQHGFLIKAVIA